MRRWLARRFGIVRVSGDSMAPALKNGDYVVVRRFNAGGRAPRAGDVAIIRHPSLGLLVKRLVATESDDTFALSGDGLSTPAGDLGRVSLEYIESRVIWRVPGPRR